MSDPDPFLRDNRSKLRGETRYVDDLHRPGELRGGILRSPYPYARIRRIDVSRAWDIDGVKAVLTGQDVPQTPYGPTATKDWNILAFDTVLMVGDEVAAVAATTQEAVEAAIAAIEVEYEPLEPLLDPLDAEQEGAPRLHAGAEHNRPVRIRVNRGDVDTALSDAFIVRGGRFTTNRIYHGYLEPNGVIAEWDGDGRLTLWAPSHIPHRARETYAAALGIARDDVRLIVPAIGGSFGAKYVLKVHIIAAVLARAAQAPVKIILDRTDDMMAANPRVPLTIDLRIGADREGRFVGKDVVVYADAGARVYWSPNILATACTRVDSLYHFHNVRADGHLCYTNHSPTTCMRGFGNAEMLFAVESVIDQLADGLHLDPTEIRLRNIVHSKDVSIHGWRIETCQLDACIRKVQEMAGWERRANLPANRGLGIAVANHVSGYRAIDPRFEGSNAIARVNQCGDIEIETGEIDLGQGLPETYAIIAAHTLEIAPARITIESGDTKRYPYGIGTLASRGTVLGGNAVLRVAVRLRDEIDAFARREYGPDVTYVRGEVIAENHRYSLTDLARAYEARYPGDRLTARATYTPDTELPDATHYGNPAPSYPFAAHVAEVEVDPQTGRTRVIGYWAAHDSGTIVNPVAARGQVAGGVTQGIGWALMEDLVTDGGWVRNLSLRDYHLPGADDVPAIEIAFLDVPDPYGPLGAKSLSEVAIDPVTAAIGNAIAHATGKRGHDLPLSAERVWMLLHGGG